MTETFPASLPQERLWFLDQLQEKNAAYNVHVGLWLSGPLNITALIASLREIVRRHDTFRTTFRFSDGQLSQVVNRHFSLDLPLDDVTEASDPIRQAYQIAGNEVSAPFDLANGPLFRFRLIRAAFEDHVFLCSMHHIVTDSWSMQLFVKELSALYMAFCEGKPSPLAELPVRYGDYAEWQHEYFRSELLRRQLDYWKDKLKAAPALLELPTDNPRPEEQTFTGSTQTAELSDAVVNAIRKLAVCHNSTPFMVLLAAFKTLLYRYSGQPDVLVGVPVAGRTRMETEGLIGFFVNTLVLRDNLSANPRFVDVLDQLRETTLAAFANADVPFEKIVEALQPERNLSYNPVFQVMFSCIKAAVQTNTFGNLTAYPYVVSSTKSIFDLSATLIEATDGKWWMQFEYNTDLFSSERIQRMLADYTGLLEKVVEEPETDVREISLAPSFQNATVLQSGTKTQGRVDDYSPAASSELSPALEVNRSLLVEVWKKVLGIERIAIHDNFFDLGGHSLLAARLIRETEAATGRKIRVSAIFQAPTIDSFARLLSAADTALVDPMVMRLSNAPNSTSLFAIAVPGVDSFGFGTLAHRLEGEVSVYKVQANAPVVLDRPRTRQELQSLVERYITAIRSVQPKGPYSLAAMCHAAVLAQHMIVELESRGEEVNLFAVFDTWVLENSMLRPLWTINYYRDRLRLLRYRSVKDRWQTAVKTVSRFVTRNQSRPRSAWRQVYWPGGDFQAPRFRASVLLFKRPKQPYYYVRDPQMGWGERTLGGVEVCEIDCGHVEMLREPYVGIVAENIAGRLVTAEGEQPPVLSPAPVESVDGASPLAQQSVA